MNTQVGSCPQCGAPLWSPTIWLGVTPPPVTYSCSCVAGRAHYVTTTTTVTLKPIADTGTTTA